MLKYPLVKFVIIFILGIIVQHFTAIEIPVLLLIWGTAFLLLICLLIITSKTNLFLSSREITLNILIVVNILFAGISYSAIRNYHSTVYPFKETRIKNAEIYGTVKQIDLPKEYDFTLVVETDSLKFAGGKVIKPLDIICRVKLESRKEIKNIYNSLSPGDNISLKCIIQKAKIMRNPGEFDYYEYLSRQGICATAYVNDEKNIAVNTNSGFSFDGIIHNARKVINEKIESFHSANASALLKGLLLADRKNIDDETEENFINSGVIHVLAVSGLHVGFIALIFIFLFSRLNIYVRYILTIIGLIMFLLITGNPPSVFRATLMAVIMIISLLSGRGYNAKHALALAALILLLINPNELFNPGFQLSFSAVISILVVYPKFSFYISQYFKEDTITRKLLLFFAVSLSAQIGTLPFTLYYFGKLSIVGLFANLLVIPLIAMIISLGIITLTFGALIGKLAFIYGDANNVLTDILFYIVNTAGKLEFSHLEIREFSTLDSIIFYLAICFGAWAYKIMLSIRAKIITAVLITANFFLFCTLDNTELIKESRLNVVMIDVGQGDSFLIRFPDNKTALVDAGDAKINFDSGERIIYPLMKKFGIEKIDYAFISHVDSDHYRGIISLIEKSIIDTLYMPKPDSTVRKEIVFEKFVNENRIPIRFYKREALLIGGAKLYILNEQDDLQGEGSNSRSGVMKLVYGENSFLFTGDAGIKTEKKLLKRFKKFLTSTVLKVGHHGSKSSTSDNFLKFVHPKVALVSAGLDNMFKHPTPDVINRLLESNVKILRTDKHGAVILSSDGINVNIIDWK
ncbi:MAG: DNA internalization-related competence protein ComEC/Rec2 [Bacteroidota bacterium]